MDESTREISQEVEKEPKRRRLLADDLLDDLGEVGRVVDDATGREQARTMKAFAGERRTDGDDVHPGRQSRLTWTKACQGVWTPNSAIRDRAASSSPKRSIRPWAT